MKKLLFAIALLWSATAYAQSPVTNVNGLDITANNSQAVSATGHLRLRYNSGTNQLEQSIAGAAYTAVGGGGITGLTTGRIPVATSATTIGDSNFTASANALDATGIVTIFGTNATALGIGGANLTGGFSLTGASLSTISTTSGNLNLSASNVLNLQSSSGAANFGNATGIINYRSGSTGLFDMSAANGVFKTTSGAHTFGSASWSVPANLAVIGATSALNTVGMSFASNVNDGASTVVFDINNGIALTNPTASLFRLRNNGVALLNTRLNSSDGFSFVDGGGAAHVDLSTNVGAVFGYSGATFSAGAGSVSYGDGTGLVSMSGGNLTLTIIQGAPDADGTRDWGTLALRWRIGGFKRLIQGEQSVAFSATPAFDCTAGNVIHFGPVTGNVTGPTMVSGSAGEKCTVIMVKDGTAGAYTVTGSWGSNVRLAAGSTFTTGAGSLLVYSLVFDANLTTPAWVQSGGTAFN